MSSHHSSPSCSPSMDDRRSRREMANHNERRRMQCINTGFDALRNLLPVPDNEKLSKAAILRHARELIEQLQHENARLQRTSPTSPSSTAAAATVPIPTSGRARHYSDDGTCGALAAAAAAAAAATEEEESDGLHEDAAAAAAYSPVSARKRSRQFAQDPRLAQRMSASASPASSCSSDASPASSAVLLQRENIATATSMPLHMHSLQQQHQQQGSHLLLPMSPVSPAPIALPAHQLARAGLVFVPCHPYVPAMHAAACAASTATPCSPSILTSPIAAMTVSPPTPTPATAAPAVPVPAAPAAPAAASQSPRDSPALKQNLDIIFEAIAAVEKGLAVFPSDAAAAAAKAKANPATATATATVAPQRRLLMAN